MSAIPHKLNHRYYSTEGLAFMRALPAESVAMCIFDPQYEGVLEKLKYSPTGKKRQVRRHALPTMSSFDIAGFANEIIRILRPGGHCLMWMDKKILCDHAPQSVFVVNCAPEHAGKMESVDLICWNKQRLGQGRRTRCCSEYAMLFQKKPQRGWPDGCHDIPDVWPEVIPGRLSKLHPHCKPIGLQSRLIEACTEEGEIVGDFCAGSFSTMVAANNVGRRFVGCEICNEAGEFDPALLKGNVWD